MDVGPASAPASTYAAAEGRPTKKGAGDIFIVPHLFWGLSSDDFYSTPEVAVDKRLRQ